MENNNDIVQQLSQALSELLEAYDKLKEENRGLSEDNANLEDKNKNLLLKIEDLEANVNSLTNTTEKNTNELDGLLGRIKDRLVGGVNLSKEEDLQKHQEEFHIENTSLNEDITEEKSLLDEQSPLGLEEDKKENKDIDLGRVQSILNGLK